jgi:hypothetical protein
MKALVLTSYGDPETCIEYQTVPEPEAPGAGAAWVRANKFQRYSCCTGTIPASSRPAFRDRQ